MSTINVFQLKRDSICIYAVLSEESLGILMRSPFPRFGTLISAMTSPAVFSLGVTVL